MHDRNRITGGGVTAGIDLGLTLASLVRSREDAEWVQLVIEYAPAPPFNAGLPETAPKVVYERLMRSRSPAISAAREKATRIGAKFPPPAPEVLAISGLIFPRTDQRARFAGRTCGCLTI